MLFRSEIPKEFEFWGMKLGEEFFKSMRNFKTFDVIGHFERPVLILHGAEDEIVPIGYSVKAVKKYPNARLEEFAHEPHGFSEDGNRRMEAMLLYFVHECMKAHNRSLPLHPSTENPLSASLLFARYISFGHIFPIQAKIKK